MAAVLRARLRDEEPKVLQDPSVDEKRSRRPQWRGDRRPVMVRVPVSLAEQLQRLAEARGSSLSDVAGHLIAVGLTAEQPAREVGA